MPGGMTLAALYRLSNPGYRKEAVVSPFLMENTSFLRTL
jgi:hypothetical protein